MEKKFKVECIWLEPTNPEKTYGMPKGIMITVEGGKRNGFRACSKSWYFKTSPIHGESAHAEDEAIDSLLMRLENAVDDTTTEQDWK